MLQLNCCIRTGLARGFEFCMQNLGLADLTTVARLGAGAFGMVTLVKQGTLYYALKAMNKSQIVQMGLQVI
jgi:hypothetical protein